MKEVKKILVLTGPGIGDILVSMPTINNLKYSFPNAKIDVFNEVTFGAGFNILKKNKNINRVIFFDRTHPKPGFFNRLKHLPIFLFGKTGFFYKARFIFALMRQNYDIIFNCYPSTKKSAAFSFLIGRKIRAGTSNSFWAKLFNVTVLPNKKSKLEMESELIKKIGGKIKNQELEAPFDLAESDKKINELLKTLKISKKIILFHVSRKMIRSWPKENWVNIYLFFKKHNFEVIFIGGKDDLENTDEALSLIKNPISFCGKLSLEETASLLKKSELFICVNTGIMHLASIYGKKTVALQGPTFYGWEGCGKKVVNIRGTFDYSICNGPCDDLVCHIDSPKCMESISVEKVIETAKKILRIN